MNKAWLNIPTIIAIMVLSRACTNSSVSDVPEPDIGVSSENMNKHFYIIAPSGWNTFRVGDDVAVTITVTSEKTIAFPINHGVRLFVLQADKWNEVSNLMSYPPQGAYNIVSPEDGSNSPQGTEVVVPDLQDTGEPQLLRIYLLGYIFEDGKVTDEKVASYIDIQLKP